MLDLIPCGASLVNLIAACNKPIGKSLCGSVVNHSLKSGLRFADSPT